MTHFVPTRKEHLRGFLTGQRAPGVLPPESRTLLNEIKDERITSIQVIRVPIKNYIFWGLALMGTTREDVLQKFETDHIYHTLLWVNDSYLWEKQHVLKLHRATTDLIARMTGHEIMPLPLPLGHTLTIGQLVDQQREKMTPKVFTGYHAMRNNCQHFVLKAVECLGVQLDEAQQTFIDQGAQHVDLQLFRFADRLMRKMIRAMRRLDVHTHGATKPENGYSS
jgi:hypothetical protein